MGIAKKQRYHATVKKTNASTGYMSNSLTKRQESINATGEGRDLPWSIAVLWLRKMKPCWRGCGARLLGASRDWGAYRISSGLHRPVSGDWKETLKGDKYSSWVNTRERGKHEFISRQCWHTNKYKPTRATWKLGEFLVTFEQGLWQKGISLVCGKDCLMWQWQQQGLGLISPQVPPSHVLLVGAPKAWWPW